VTDCTQVAATISAILDLQAQLNTTKTYSFKILLSCAAAQVTRARLPTSHPAVPVTSPAQAPRSS